MKFIYPAIIHKEDSSYWGEFIDLDGCFSQGDSIEEIITNLEESMEGYLLSLIDRNIKIPTASDINTLSVEDGFLSLISINFDSAKLSKSIKKTLTIPYWLNERAIDKNINFSKALQDKLIEMIEM